jgi:hypothetical protein
MYSGYHGFNAKTRPRNERGQFIPSGGRNGGGWILVHNDVFYLIDFDEVVKLSVMGLALQSARGGGLCSTGWGKGNGAVASTATRWGKGTTTVSPTAGQGKGVTESIITKKKSGHKHEASQRVRHWQQR